MITQILGIAALLLTIVWGVAKWIYNPKRKREEIERKIKSWEVVLRYALTKGNAVRISIANAELERLRREISHSA